MKMRKNDWYDVAMSAMAEVTKYRLLVEEILRPNPNPEGWAELREAVEVPDAIARHRMRRSYAAKMRREAAFRSAERMGWRCPICDEGGHPL